MQIICVVPECGGHPSILEHLLHGQHHIIGLLSRVLTAISTEGNKIVTDINTELDGYTQDIVNKIDALDADLARELADFAAEVSPVLSDAQKSKLAAISGRLADLDTKVNTADPAPAAPVDPGTPVDGTTPTA